MTNQQLRDHLMPHIYKICIAVAGKQDGAINEAIDELIEAIADIKRSASDGGSGDQTIIHAGMRLRAKS